MPLRRPKDIFVLSEYITRKMQNWYSNPEIGSLGVFHFTEIKTWEKLKLVTEDPDPRATNIEGHITAQRKIPAESNPLRN